MWHFWSFESELFIGACHHMKSLIYIDDQMFFKLAALKQPSTGLSGAG